tara:strand:- start:2563 stop:3516 length:954 start_codon:yes stop_codon:yes gene_type:complete
MRNLLTPIIGFVIGSGVYLSTKVLADTQSGKMPGPKSFGYFITAITAASVAGVALLGKDRNFYSEEGSAPVQDPMEFGEMANWTPLDGSEGLKRKRAEKSSDIFITYDDTEFWLGSDNTLDEAIEIITDVANGRYTPENLKKDILSTKESIGWNAEGPSDSLDVGEKQQTRNKREDFNITSDYTSDLEVGDIDLDNSTVSDELHDEVIDAIRTSVDASLPLEDGESDSDSMDVDIEVELPINVTGTVDYDWLADLNYETDADVDEHDWSAEQINSRVRTMSGKPVSETLRKMKHDKNITPEEARERKEIRAENFRKY